MNLLIYSSRDTMVDVFNESPREGVAQTFFFFNLEFWTNLRVF